MPDPVARRRVARATGADVQRLEPVTRGYTNAQRWRAVLSDGRRVFAKLAVDQVTAGWLRAEHLIYTSLRDARFMLPLVAFDPGDPASDSLSAMPALVLPDVTDAHWPPPWDGARIAAVRLALKQLHSTPAPDWLPGAEEGNGMLADSWTEVAADPAPFLSLGS